MRKLFVILPFFLLLSCINASTFGMKQKSYERNLLSLKNKTIPLSLQYIMWGKDPKETGGKKAEYVKKNPDILRILEDTISFKGVKPGKAEKVKRNLIKFFPEIYQEIKYFAKESRLPENKLLSIAGTHFHVGGCSIYLKSAPLPLLARNYDWAPTLADKIIASNKKSKNCHASISISASLFGSLSGINHHGLSIAIAGISSKNKFPNNGGICMPIIVKGILNKAMDVNSAIVLLKKIPHTTPCNYSLADTTGTIAVVEVSSGGIAVRKNSPSKKFLTATNHYQSLSNDTEKIYIMKHSLRRQETLERFHRSNPGSSMDEILEFMGNKKTGPAMTNYSMMFGTLWTILYIPGKREMIIRIGLSGKTAAFTVGKNNITSVRGTLIDSPPRLRDYL